MSTSASGPFVIHIFDPFATHPPSTGSARHDIDPITSDPASASLIAKAPTCSPVSSFGSQRSRCSCVPLAHRLCTHKLECAAYDMPIDADAREISSTTTRCSRKPSPAPPSSSGTVGPKTPISPSRGQSHRGKVSSRSMASASGASSRSANARTVSRSSSTEMRSLMAHTLRRRPRVAAATVWCWR